MLGAIIGDIVGSIYEFNPIKTKEFNLFSDNCGFTDDTVMTIAIAEAILKFKEDGGNFRKIVIDSLKKYGNEYPYIGYGGSFSKWLLSDDPQPYYSYGNGSAMRVSPCGIFFDNYHDVKKFASITAEVTHNHPDGIAGAQATAVAVFMAKNGYSKAEIKSAIEKEFYIIPKDLNKLRETYDFEISCEKTVPAAILSFLEADSFEDAVRNAVSLGGDSDTLAAITGAIAEQFFGIPEEIQNKAKTYLDNNLKNTLIRCTNYIK